MAYDSVDFFLSFPLDVWVEAHQEEEGSIRANSSIGPSSI